MLLSRCCSAMASRLRGRAESRRLGRLPVAAAAPDGAGVLGDAAVEVDAGGETDDVVLAGGATVAAGVVLAGVVLGGGVAAAGGVVGAVGAITVTVTDDTLGIFADDTVAAPLGSDSRPNVATNATVSRTPNRIRRDSRD